MDDLEIQHEALESIINDANAEPIMLQYALLKLITNNFSEVIGSGGFGVVYMGVLPNGKIAVKKLFKINEFSEKQFEDELTCLMRVKHKNIVRCLGYCSDTSKRMEPYNGTYVFADIRQRFLCFEYVPNKSLSHYLKDDSKRHEWDTRYQLIVGICQGLRYLHNEEHINHLDLKPENILLDAYMVPKIADFGLSRRFSGAQSRLFTEKLIGSLGYMAPEYRTKGEISFKSDIFSLGVIISKVFRGSTDLSDVENWHESVDIDCPRVKRCIKIAQLCVDNDQLKRPTIGNIIDMLNEKETLVQMVSQRNYSGSSSEQQASSSVSKLMDEVQSMAVSAAPSHSQQQRIIGVPKGPGETSTELFKDESNATSNVCTTSMANTQSGSTTTQPKGTQYNCSLYMHQSIDGPNRNQVNIADPKQPLMFGYTNVHDYPIYDSLSSSAKLVARAQGLHTETSMNYNDWFHWSSIVFINERFRGSSFKAIGNQTHEGEWAIIGGTGVFAFAQGTISISRIDHNGSSNIKEIRIIAFCCIPQTAQTETKPFKDGLIKVIPNATSNVGSPSMAIPHFQETQYNRQLYMHQTIDGPNHNQVNIADPKQPLMFGYTNVHDYPIYDSLSGSAKIVARAQGLHTETSMNYNDWFHWSSIVFTDERFKGSSFKAIGNQNGLEGEWAIVGGTGLFTFAQGTISIRRIHYNGSSNIKKIHISAFCRTPQTTPTEIKPFMDGWIKVDSNAASNVSSPSMTNPHSQETEYNRNLYMHQSIDGPNRNQVNIADPKQPLMFGYTNVHDYPIYDSLSISAKIVARAQGLHTETSMNYDDWFHWSSIVFIDERFQGSSFKAIGNQNHEGEWAIVGGTGVFAFAQGTISIHRIKKNGSSNIKKIHIRAFCRTIQTTPTETKVNTSF